MPSSWTASLDRPVHESIDHLPTNPSAGSVHSVPDDPFLSFVVFALVFVSLPLAFVLFASPFPAGWRPVPWISLSVALLGVASLQTLDAPSLTFRLQAPGLSWLF